MGPLWRSRVADSVTAPPSPISNSRMMPSLDDPTAACLPPECSATAEGSKGRGCVVRRVGPWKSCSPFTVATSTRDVSVTESPLGSPARGMGAEAEEKEWAGRGVRRIWTSTHREQGRGGQGW